jgi:methylthioribose-1-phosphate isomerase
MLAVLRATGRAGVFIKRPRPGYDARVEPAATRDLQSIWLREDAQAVCIIDQRALPFRLRVEELDSLEAVCTAIREMHLRGAPLIGVAAAYGMYLAALEAARSPRPGHLHEAARRLVATRPTAANLAWAVRRQLAELADTRDAEQSVLLSLRTAQAIEQEDVERCRRIGEHGRPLLEGILARKAGPARRVNVLTHCNAGWLACVRYGTATAPLYAAHRAGIPLHVWVDETRPRNQGGRLTAWELERAGVPHTVIADNAGGHLMQHGQVDLVIVGADRVSRRGDVANKIGTYLKALAARDNGLPFYAALPTSTIDWSIGDGLAEIPIEERDAREVRYVEGLADGRAVEVLVTSPSSPAANYAFDVTPARLLTGLITEAGVVPASEEGLARLAPAPPG